MSGLSTKFNSMLKPELLVFLVFASYFVLKNNYLISLLSLLTCLDSVRDEWGIRTDDIISRAQG